MECKFALSARRVRDRDRCSRYKTRDDFYADVQLMFVNCVTFNEDDSPVGKAGHSMKTFFDEGWAELIAH